MGGVKMKITELVIQKVEAVQADMTGALAAEVRSKAVAATLGGLNSQAWQDYMSMFAEAPDQLSRLTLRDGTADDSQMQEAAVYLVANGAVGGDTFLKLGENQEGLSVLDLDLSDRPILVGDPTVSGKP
jgi:hypothetical protein